jgi:hypothetical protein
MKIFLALTKDPFFTLPEKKSMKRGHDICRSVTSKPEAPPTNAEKQPRV